MRRPLCLGLAAVGVLALLTPGRLTLPKLLVWNASASAPIGLYQLLPGAPARLGDWVAADAPPALAALFATRRYLPLGLPLVKRIAAMAPSQVCREGPIVTIEGQPQAEALAADTRGRSLPVWRGCYRLRPGEVLLLNPARASLDGRYFGPLDQRQIRGRLIPLWLVRSADR
jgi:type IV secretory pathway protease TraF